MQKREISLVSPTSAPVKSGTNKDNSPAGGKDAPFWSDYLEEMLVAKDVLANNRVLDRCWVVMDTEELIEYIEGVHRLGGFRERDSDEREARVVRQRTVAVWD